MTRTQILIPASLALALVAGVSSAQTSNSPASDAGPSSAAVTPMQVASGETAPNWGAYNPNPTVVTAQTAPPAQIQALAAGDNKLVTNGPIPDTAANRKRYGEPLSHAGRVSPPNGN